MDKGKNFDGKTRRKPNIKSHGLSGEEGRIRDNVAKKFELPLGQIQKQEK